MNKNFFNWKVAGLSGEGIMVSGLIFSKAIIRHGFQVFDYAEYPSIVTGGHNTYQIYADRQAATCQKHKLDLLVALYEDSLLKHKNELTENSITIFDSRDDKIEIAKHGLPGKIFDLPMIELAVQAGGERLMGNNVALGASCAILGLDLEILKNVINETFSRKGEEIVKVNQAAAELGYKYAQDNFGVSEVEKRAPQLGEKVLSMTGNEAIALGALAGGLQFYVAYPMTPSSSVLHNLAAMADEVGIVVKHAEDEIGAINMALGASFTGVRAMTGTSGGGFAYMTEALGLAGVAELPLVVLESMRPGPALGMPTWTAQGDLQFVLHASQDEFPRLVLAPADAAQAFELSRQAQDLAEKYQTVVIILSDKYLSESRYTLPVPVGKSIERHGFAAQAGQTEAGFYPRYQSDQIINERSLPGQAGGTYVANSYEHDEYGLATEEASERVTQMNKRLQKFELIKKEVPTQFYSGSAEDQLTFLSFGSTKGVLLEAARQLATENIKIGILNLSWLWPFPTEQVKQVLSAAKNLVVIEGNQYGQLKNLIAQETGIQIEKRFNKYDGRPFYPEEIVDYVKKDIGNV